MATSSSPSLSHRVYYKQLLNPKYHGNKSSTKISTSKCDLLLPHITPEEIKQKEYLYLAVSMATSIEK